MSTLLYFGNDWSAENRTSSHHIARRLAQKHEVYYIECPGMRAPRGSGRDLKRIFQKLGKAIRGPRQALPGLKVATLFQVPFHRFRLVRWFNAKLIHASVRLLMWRKGICKPILWFTIPHVASLVGRLGESLSVYYCTDEHAALPGVDIDFIRATDARLTREADCVFVASDTLLAAKSAINASTYHSPHGVDVEHFGAAQLAGAMPTELAAIRGPIIGFFGLIEHWIDLDLVAYLARERPQWSFVMIGRVAVHVDCVPHLPNLHFLGKRPYEQLPEYGRHFDSAIIPYKLNTQVFHANPLKLREYLAMGKPIVSVSTPETNKYADVVEIAANREDFLAKLDKIIAQRDNPEAITRRLASVASSSWDARVQEVLGRVDGALEKKQKQV